MRTIVRQTSIGVIEQTLKIEQRSDVRIRLAVVVTEEAFVVTGQAREDVRSDELIVIRKSLGGRNLDSAVKTLSASETTWLTSVGDIAIARKPLGGAGLVPTGVEDEVGITVVERTILDHITHVTIDTSGADGEVLDDL